MDSREEEEADNVLALQSMSRAIGGMLGETTFASQNDDLCQHRGRVSVTGESCSSCRSNVSAATIYDAER
jgi:hypothetical protein